MKGFVLVLLLVACVALPVLSGSVPMQCLPRDQKDVGLSQQRLYLFFCATCAGAIRESNLNQAATLLSKYHTVMDPSAVA